MAAEIDYEELYYNKVRNEDDGLEAKLLYEKLAESMRCKYCNRKAKFNNFNDIFPSVCSNHTNFTMIEYQHVLAIFNKFIEYKCIVNPSKEYFDVLYNEYKSMTIDDLKYFDHTLYTCTHDNCKNPAMSSLGISKLQMLCDTHKYQLEKKFKLATSLWINVFTNTEIYYLGLVDNWKTIGKLESDMIFKSCYHNEDTMEPFKIPDENGIISNIYKIRIGHLCFDNVTHMINGKFIGFCNKHKDNCKEGTDLLLIDSIEEEFNKHKAYVISLLDKNKDDINNKKKLDKITTRCMRKGCKSKNPRNKFVNTLFNVYCNDKNHNDNLTGSIFCSNCKNPIKTNAYFDKDNKDDNKYCDKCIHNFTDKTLVIYNPSIVYCSNMGCKNRGVKKYQTSDSLILKYACKEVNCQPIDSNIEVISRLSYKCKHDKCENTAICGIKGSRTLLKCLAHKTDDLDILKQNACIIDNCFEKAQYNEKEEHYRLYCENHKTQTMEIKEKLICRFKDCNEEAKYGHIKSRENEYCYEHKDILMINHNYLVCTEGNCNKVALYVTDKNDKSNIKCGEHRTINSFDYHKKLCNSTNCIKPAQYGFLNDEDKDNKIKRIENTVKCNKCKEIGMISLKTDLCQTYLCDNPVINKRIKLCKSCLNHHSDIKYANENNAVANFMRKEIYIRNLIKEEFKEITFSYDKKIIDGCSNRRPDLYIEFLHHVLIVEIDENQHKAYDTTCNEIRNAQLLEDVGNKIIVIIRFNCDAYKKNNITYASPFKKVNKNLEFKKNFDKNQEWKDRLNKLYEQIKLYANDDLNTNDELLKDWLIKNIYIAYDE